MHSNVFTFKDYWFDDQACTATFVYQNNNQEFSEVIVFATAIANYDAQALDRALFLAFITIGTSYYKSFPSTEIKFEKGTIDEEQAEFLNHVYQEGLSQFAYENNLTRDDLATFKATGRSEEIDTYESLYSAPLVLQSGGKDSLLLARMLEQKETTYAPWFLQNTQHHPLVLDALKEPLLLARRTIDIPGLEVASEHGGKNGHVPVTYIVLSIAVVQAILLGKDTVLAAIGREGEEPHATIGDLSVTHQWSKTWLAETRFADYIHHHVAPNIQVGSPLRQFSELKIAELFVEHCWDDYKTEFSSCNRANYQQGQTNERLQWCGDCPKCANSFLLFAAYVKPADLISVFRGENLFIKPSLTETFKGLLGVDGVMKPFECVGEIDELRKAYQLGLERGYMALPFEVPSGKFDIGRTGPAQEWAKQIIS